MKGMCMATTAGYVGLFGESGAALADTDWLAHANRHPTPNLKAFNAEFIAGRREDRYLQIAYTPPPTAFNVAALSGGSLAEMLDQAATHCGTFVTGHPCPTMMMTVTFLRPGLGDRFVAEGRVHKVNSASVVLGAELFDERGRPIATASVVSHLLTDMDRLVAPQPAQGAPLPLRHADRIG